MFWIADKIWKKMVYEYARFAQKLRNLGFRNFGTLRNLADRGEPDHALTGAPQKREWARCSRCSIFLNFQANLAYVYTIFFQSLSAIQNIS